MAHQFAKRVAQVGEAFGSFQQFFYSDLYALSADPNTSNFAIGNPHEMPLQGFVDALSRHVTPHNKDWYAYKLSEEPTRRVIAQTLREWRGVAFEPDDILMTNGAFAAISVVLNALVDNGDEVIFMSPPWFFYEALIRASGGIPVRMKVKDSDFDLDIEALEVAITPKTRVVMVNSPNNPTGRIYPEATLRALAGVLTRASERYGHPIYLLSDEAYSRIIFDGKKFLSPTDYYPNSLLIYTYGKTLLTPGQRIGYIALPPTMPEREAMVQALFLGQVMVGYAFPNALLQHAIADLEKLTIDIEHLQEKRDWLVGALRDAGYDVHSPEGTFYLLPRAPIADDWAFARLLGEHQILCLPGTVVEKPGYFRLSLTASDDMIERAIPNFAKALQKAKG